MNRYKVMPFGLACAKHFSFIIKRILAIFRKRGIRCTFYLDDIIFLARSRAEALGQRCFVLDMLYRLGLRVSINKSLLDPGQLIRHLGLDACTLQGSIWVPEDKVLHFKQLAKTMLEHCRQPVAAREAARAVGTRQAFRVACGAVAPFTRGLSRTLDQLPRRQGGVGAVQDMPFGTRPRQEAAPKFYEARDYAGAKGFGTGSGTAKREGT